MTESGHCLTWLLNFVIVFVVFKLCMLLSYRNFVKFLISKSLSVRSRTGYSLLRLQLWTLCHLHLYLLLWQRLSLHPKVSGVQGGVWCRFHPNGPLEETCCLRFSYPWAVWALLVRNRIVNCHVLPLPSKGRPFSGSLGTHAWDLVVFSCVCGYWFLFLTNHFGYLMVYSQWIKELKAHVPAGTCCEILSDLVSWGASRILSNINFHILHPVLGF